MRRVAAAAGLVALVTSCTAVSATPGSPPGIPTATTPTDPSATRTARSTTPPAPDSVRLLFTGDMLPSDALREQAGRYAGGQGFDFMPMLAEVAPLIADADWAFCHQETPVSDDDIGLAGYPRFNAPYELAEAEKAVGYDACSTASNHTWDLGAAGITATLGTFDRVGLGHSGSARSAAEQSDPPIYDVDGVHVGHLAYTFALNGLSSPAQWAVNLIDPATIRSDAAALKRGGADLVVVSLHFGTEKDQTPSSYQERVVDEVLAGPEVDLLVGHHAHVVQPVERRPDGRWVIFGLGNFLAQQEVLPGDPTPAHRDGVIIEVTIGRSPDHGYHVTQVGYVPTFVDAPTDVIRLAPAFSRARTEAALFARGAPLVDLTPP